MKTKKSLVILTCLALMSFGARAQSGSLQAAFDIGYGFPGGMSEFVDYSSDGNTRTIVPYSYGAGLNLDLGATYFLGDHIGVGLDLDYIMGTPIVYHDFINEPPRGSMTVNNTMTSTFLGVTPNIMLSLNNPGINPYARLGVALGAATVVRTSTEDGTDAHDGTYIETTSGNIAIGLYSAMGIQFGLSDNLALNVELFGRTMTYGPGQTVNTQAYDGEQKNPTITYAQHIDNTTAANTALMPELPFSSVGLKVGITMKFNAQ